MKKLIIILLSLLIIPNHAWSVFSSLAHITPETENGYGMKVDFEPLIGHEIGCTGKFYIKFKAIDHAHKHAWLIIVSDPLSIGEQEFRYSKSKLNNSGKRILGETKLIPVAFGGNFMYYFVELESSIIERSYIYIDFPGVMDGTSIVSDGGYYYTIDLNSYYKRWKKNANKALRE